MEEYKVKNATVRIHGNYDSDKLKEATVNFLKKVEAQRRRKAKSSTE
jgi:hypothetical protein